MKKKSAELRLGDGLFRALPWPRWRCAQRLLSATARATAVAAQKPFSHKNIKKEDEMLSSRGTLV